MMRRGAHGKGSVSLFQQPLRRLPQGFDHQPPVLIEHPIGSPVLQERVMQGCRNLLVLQDERPRKLVALFR